MSNSAGQQLRLRVNQDHGIRPVRHVDPETLSDLPESDIPEHECSKRGFDLCSFIAEYHFNDLRGCDHSGLKYRYIPEGHYPLGISRALGAKGRKHKMPIPHIPGGPWCDLWAVYATLFNGDFLQMSHAKLSITTYEDLMSIRAITGVLRVVEHHLTIGITTKFVEEHYAAKLPDETLMEEFVDYLESNGFVVEYATQDDGVGLNAYLTKPMSRNDQLRQALYTGDYLAVALRLNYTNGQCTFAVYLDRTEKNFVELVRKYFRQYEIQQPVKLDVVVGFDAQGRVMKDPREIVPGHDIPEDVSYPYIEGGVQKLITDYYAARASLLMLIGPWGTGKSSLLAEICRHAGDRKIMQIAGTHLLDNPHFLAFFSRLPKKSLLIIEDADMMLGHRNQGDGNTAMSVLLNELQGIASKGIKLVLTTNIDNPSKIDQALIRAGRCFKMIHCRNLTLDEATQVATHYGKSKEHLVDDISLASIFDGPGVKVQDIGFRL